MQGVQKPLQEIQWIPLFSYLEFLLTGILDGLQQLMWTHLVFEISSIPHLPHQHPKSMYQLRLIIFEVFFHDKELS